MSPTPNSARPCGDLQPLSVVGVMGGKLLRGDIKGMGSLAKGRPRT